MKKINKIYGFLKAAVAIAVVLALVFPSLTAVKTMDDVGEGTMIIESKIVNAGDTNVLLNVTGSWSTPIGAYQIIIVYDPIMITRCQVDFSGTIAESAQYKEIGELYGDGKRNPGVLWLPATAGPAAGEGLLFKLWVDISPSAPEGTHVLQIMDHQWWPDPVNGPSRTRFSTQDGFGYYADTTEGVLKIGNLAPYTPDAADPVNGATDVELMTCLTFDAGDPDVNDQVTYDIYFDDELKATVGPEIADGDTNEITYCNDDLDGDGVQGLPFSSTHTWYVVAEDNYGASATSLEFEFTTTENAVPSNPTIVGMINLVPGEEADYKFKAIDPDGHDVFFSINWGDGSYGTWEGPYASGEEAVFSHSWSMQGKYEIKVKVKDVFGDESEEEGTHKVTVPNEATTPIFIKILQTLCDMFPRIGELLQVIFPFLA